MSKQVDERVVEMRFDNKQFESGVKDTMSTLDKFKQKLQLKDATKGLNDLEKAAKKVDLNPLGKAAEAVSVKFSAMQVAGVTAIANLTNSAVNAGKNIAKALTITPVTTGFQEYETQIGAIQTILANTQKEGTNVERVNAALDELNEYADQTIYNFTEMTRNIGTFTAAGVKLDDSVSAIKGIANLAAVSGSTSQQASTAMYQLSQALAAGKVSLTDWNSVVTAGMGGQVFQDALIRTSENLKTGAKQAIATYGTFRESLTKSGWLTKEVLTETLGQLAGVYSEADLLAKGYSTEQAKEIVKLAETAKSAATDVKTFTQLWGTMKEAVQSGWSQTWRTIIGDFDEAKERMTKLSKLFGDIIKKSSDRRNSMFSGALDSNWSKLTKQLNDAGIKTEDFQNKIKELAKTHNVNLDEMIKQEGSFEKALKKAFSSGTLDKSILMDAIQSFIGGIKESANAAKASSDQMEKYGEIVDKVIRGDFGNGAERIKKLTDAGYEYAEVQNLVNKKLGSSVRHLSSLNDEQIKNADSLADLTDEQLKSKGYTEEQIIALKDLKKEANNANSSIYKLITGFEKPSGVELAWGSVFNILDSITESCKAIQKAWTEIFHPGMTEDQIIAERSERLYKLLESIHAFTESLKINEETAKKITRTFKGLFAVLDLIRIVVGGTFGVAFTIVKEILSAFNLNILDATAYVGDVVVKFRDWLKSLLDFKKIFTPIVNSVKSFITVIREWFDEFKKSEEVQKLTEKFQEFSESIKMDGSAADNFKKITEGLSALFTKLNLVLNASLLSGLKVLGAVLNLFGTDLAKIAANMIDYLAKAKQWVNENILIANTVDEVAKILKTLIDGIKNCVKAFMALEPVQKFIENFKNSFKNLFGIIGNMFSGLGVENFADGLAKAFKTLQTWIESLKNSDNIGRDIILGLLNGLKAGAGTIVSFIINLGKSLLNAIKAVLGIHSPSTKFFEIGSNMIAGLINGLKAAVSALLSFIGNIGQKCVDVISKIDFSKVFTIAISAGIIYSGKKIYDLAEKFAAPLEGLGKMFGGIGHMFNSVGKILDNFAGMIKVKKYEAIAKMFLNLGIAIGIMAASVYVLSNIPDKKLWNAVKAVGALAAIFGILAVTMNIISGASASISKDGIKINGLKTTLISLGVALLLMATTVKMIGNLTEDQAKQGFLGLAGLVAAIAIVAIAFGTLVKGKSAQNIDKFGIMMTKLSIALLLMVSVVKIVGNLTDTEITNGIHFLTVYIAFVSTMAVVANFVTASAKSLNSLGTMLFKISAAILLMGIAAKLIGTLTPDEMIKGAAFLVVFSFFVRALVEITKIDKNEQIAKVGSLVLAISSAIIIMALACKIIETLSNDAIIRGLGFLVVFTFFVGALVAITKIDKNEQIAKVSAIILAISVAIGMLAAVCVLLGLVDEDTLIKGVTAVTVLGIMMAVMLKTSKEAEKAKGAIIAMTVAIGIMAAAVFTLSFVPWEKLLPAVAGMSVLMLVFGVMAKLAGSAQGSIAPLIVMTVAVGLLGGVIYALAQLPIESVVGSAAALSILLLSMSVSLKILATLGSNVGYALAGVVGLLALWFPLKAFIDVLSAMQGIQNAMSNAIVLAGFTTVMTVLLTALTGVGLIYTATFGLAATGILGLLALWLPLKAFIDVLSAMQGIQNAQANSNILITLMGAMTILLTQVSLLGPLALIGVTAITAMSAVMVALSGLVIAVGALNKKFPQLEAFLGSGISLLSQLANGLGQVIGNFISGFAQGVTSGLPEIATTLSMFMVNLTPFIIGAKMIDESVLTNVKTLAGVILALTGAGILEGIASWINGGESPIARFAEQIVPFGKAMVSFSNTVKGIDEGAVTAAANAGKMMAEMAKTIPREGGLWKKIAGEKDIVSFGNKLVAFGTAIKNFSFTLTIGGTIDTTAIESAANAGKQMAEMADSIPKSGGWWQAIAGEQDIALFGAKIVAYGSAIKAFIATIKKLKIDEETLTSSINAGKKMVEFSEIIPKSGGWWQAIAGEQDIADFGGKIVEFGKAIKDFSGTISGNITGIDPAIKSINNLISLLKNISSVDSGAIDSFKTSLYNLGNTSVSSFINSFNGVDSKAKAVINKFLNAISNAVINGKESVNKSFKTVGSYLVDGFAKGITENTFKAEARAKAMAKAAYDAARKELDEHSPSKKFAKIGAFVVAGFANGIVKNIGDANKASVKMANGVLEATQNELGIHSPSIVFDKEVGRYIVQGIAEGIKKDMSAEEAAEKKAQNIISAFQKTFDRIDREKSIKNKEFDLWNITYGKNASDAEKAEKQIEKLTNDLYEDNQKVTFANSEWQQMVTTFGENSDEARKAYSELLDAQIQAGNSASALIEGKESIAQSIITNQEQAIEDWSTINNNGLEIIELMQANGMLIPDDVKDRQYLSVYKDIAEGKKTEWENAKKKYEDLLAKYGDMNHPLVREAKIAVQNAEKDFQQALSSITDYEDSIVDREIKAIDDGMSHRDDVIRRWEALNGDNASEEERYTFYKNMYEIDASDLWKKYRTQLKDYNEFVEDLATKNDITIQEAKQTKKAVDLWNNEVYPAYVDAEEGEKKVRDLTKDYLEQQKNDLKEQYETASDIADLKYQIWEKTTGRKATDTEKDNMKLAFLTEQLGLQAKLVAMAEEAWKNAKDDEKLKYEQEYWSAQLELANLQNEVLDIQEANTKRQERALDRQRNAQDEYKDYVKKYKKYYLDNGMTIEELERDAKLVSGYDPSNIVNTVVNKTNTAIDNIKANVSNLTKAVGEGIQNGVSDIANNTTFMLNSCSKALVSEKGTWSEAGMTLVQSFINGIKSKMEEAVNTAAELAAKTLETIQGIFNGDMDYKPTITPVLDMSNVSSGLRAWSPTWSAKRSLRLASSVSNIAANGYSSSNVSTKSPAPVYSFTQINNSPKALSSVEIYRQTNNMISRIGKKVT